MSEALKAARGTLRNWDRMRAEGMETPHDIARVAGMMAKALRDLVAEVGGDAARSRALADQAERRRAAGAWRARLAANLERAEAPARRPEGYAERIKSGTGET